MSALIFAAATALVYAAGYVAIDARLRRNARWWLYFYYHFHKSIPMSLTSAQLDTLQSDLDALKAAVAADTTAQNDLAAAQAALVAAQATEAQTGPAVAAAEQQLLSDANADFNPPAA